MKHTHLSLLLASLVLGVLGCSSGDTITARLSNANGIEAGAPVAVAGVAVGSVKSVSVVDGHAQVVMAIDDGQDVSLHEDACARVGSVGDDRGLLIFAGDDGDFDEDYLSLCTPSLIERAVQLQQDARRVTSETAREAGRELTKTAREFSRGLNDGSDDLRETGANLTMAAEAFGEGAAAAAMR